MKPGEREMQLRALRESRVTKNVTPVTKVVTQPRPEAETGACPLCGHVPAKSAAERQRESRARRKANA